MEEKEKELFLKYFKVQMEGNYNMYTEADKAAKDAGLTPEEYTYVFKNYSILRDQYGDSEEAKKIKQELFNEICNK